MSRSKQTGITLLELMIAILIIAILLAGLNSIVGMALNSRDVTHERKQLVEHAQFAMMRITMASRNSSQLLLPLADNPATDWPENLRAQTVPATPPVGSSTLATAVLAIALPAYSDLDGDGSADADDDNDGDIDEDLPADRYNDTAPGIYLIDDDGDGSVDEGGNINDDDEDGLVDEDDISKKDNDKDGNSSEDPGGDNNADGCAGLCGVDDDGDGSIDESSSSDNDEDNSSGEDWINALVFYLNNDTLIERTPVPWDTNGGSRNGRDFIETAIAENVTAFSIERIGKNKNRNPLLDITLQLTTSNGDSVTLNTRVRVGGAL